MVRAVDKADAMLMLSRDNIGSHLPFYLLSRENSLYQTHYQT